MTQAYWKNRWLWAVVIVSIGFAIFTRFYAIETIPFGADGDVMWMSVDAADLVLDGVIPHYVDPVYAPDPVIVYLIGLSQVLFGVSMSTARIVTGTTSVLTAIVMLPMMWELLRDEKPLLRISAGVLAMMAVASSLHSINMARLGHDSPVLALAVALTIWWTAAAWYRGGWWRWLIAGIFLASTQYIYLTGRMMALVAPVWFIYTLLANRLQFMKRWQGWILMALVSFLLLLPNIVLFVLWPSSFTARVDPGANIGLVGFIWDSNWASEGRLLEFFLQKIWNIIQVTGIIWRSNQLPMNTPILAPVFFIGWCVGILFSIIRIRRVGYGLVLLALPILTLGDLITSPTLIPIPMRHNQILPVHYAFAGIGLAVIWSFLQQYMNRTTQIVLGIAFVLVVFVPPITGYYHYVTITVPEFYADPANSNTINQTDIEISNRIVAEPQRTYLLPYGEYTRKTQAWLTLAAFPERHSAVMADGTINIPDLPENIVLVQSAVPNRARHDLGVGLDWNRWWVLLHDGQVLLLAPFDGDQVDDLMALITVAPSEDIVDSSNQVVATFYTIPLPDHLLTMPEYVPVDAMLGKSLDHPEVQLLGYSTYPDDPVAGEPMFVSLYWKPLFDPNESYEIFVQLWDDNAQVYGESHELPYEATYRTRLWRADEITVTHHVLFIKDDLPAQRYSLAVNFYRIVQDEALLASGADTSPDHQAALLDDFRIVPEQDHIRLDTLDMSIQFGDLLKLDHLDIQVDGNQLDAFDTWTLEANQTIDIVMQWDVLERPYLDYSYFMHLTPADEQEPVAQFDRALSVNGLLAGAWRTGDSWFDSTQFQIPPNISTGTYELWLGVYYYGDGTRLSAQLDGEAQADSRILLGQIIVE